MNSSKMLNGIFPLKNGIPMKGSGLLYKLLSPLTLLTVPTIQRFNYWFNIGLIGDYKTYHWNQKNLIPYVFKPLASLGSIKYKTIVHFDNVTEQEFKNDVENNSVMVISNHVDLSDFAVLIRLACHYGIESRVVAYFAQFVNYIPFLGPSLWGQGVPLSRDSDHPEKDEQMMNERLEMYAGSDDKEICLIFTEGLVRRNPKGWLRTKEKKEKYGIDGLNYTHYPKSKGFKELTKKLGFKMSNLYELVLLYDEQHLALTGNEVHVIVRRVCKVSEIPTEPTAEFVNKHNITLDPDNTLHYAHEEFLLKRHLGMDEILTEWYEGQLGISKEDAPTNANIYAIRMKLDKESKHSEQSE